MVYHVPKNVEHVNQPFGKVAVRAGTQKKLKATMVVFSKLTPSTMVK